MLLVYIMVCLLCEGFVRSTDSHFDGKQASSASKTKSSVVPRKRSCGNAAPDSGMFEPWPKCCDMKKKQDTGIMKCNSEECGCSCRNNGGCGEPIMNPSAEGASNGENMGGNMEHSDGFDAEKGFASKDYDVHTMGKGCENDIPQCSMGMNACKTNAALDAGYEPNKMSPVPFTPTENGGSEGEDEDKEVEESEGKEANPESVPPEISNEERLQEDVKLAESMKDMQIKFSGSPCTNRVIPPGRDLVLQPYTQTNKKN